MAHYTPLEPSLANAMLISRTKNSTLTIQLWATLLVALSGTLYGFIGYFGTQIMDKGLSVSTMLFWRFFIAFLWIALFSLFRKTPLFSSLKLNKLTLLKMFCYATLTFSGASAFYFMASQEIGTGVAMVIFFSYPVFVALAGWLTRKVSFNFISVSSLIAIMMGIYLLKGQGQFTLSFYGILLAMAASFFYACYIVGSKKQANQLSSEALTFLVCLGNLALFLCLSLYRHEFVLPTTMALWINIIALGIFATALPIQLLLDGLKHISSLKASILSVLEPVVTLLVGVVLLNEGICQIQILGIFIILIGAILIQFER